MSVTIRPRSSWTSTPFAWPRFPGRLHNKARVTYYAPHYPAIPGVIGVLSAAEEEGWLRTIRGWHVSSPRNWADIGYALVVGQSGRAYMAGGITHTTAHAGSANPISIGVLFLVGNDEAPTQAAINTFNAIGRWLRDTQGFTALTTVRDHGRLPGQATACAGVHVRSAVDDGALTLGSPMSAPIAENGWRTIRFAQTYPFLAPNGKIVYCRDYNTSVVLGYIAWRWHMSVGPIAPAQILEGDSDTNWRGGVRDGTGGKIIAIHAWRPAAHIAGTSIYSVHGTGMAMDVNGHLHPYEFGNPNWRSGFTQAQVNQLRAIKQEVRGLAAGADILRLGIDFSVGRRDGMHVELVPRTASQVATAARSINALGWIMPWRRGDIRAYQAFIGITADDFHGNGTTKALQDLQRSKRLGVTGRWDVPTRTATVQERLTALGYDPGPVDGIPGPAFAAALREFQSDQGLHADAIAGQDTLDRLRTATPKKSPLVESIQEHLNFLGLDLVVDGRWGAATLSGAQSYAQAYNYPGNVTDHRSLLNHLENTMQNVLTAISALTDEVRALRDATPTAKDNAYAVWGHPLYGFRAHWHLRDGYITDPDHRNFPADPGSPAYHDLVERAKALGGRVTVYTPDGEMLLYFDSKTGTFQKNPIRGPLEDGEERTAPEPEA